MKKNSKIIDNNIFNTNGATEMMKTNIENMNSEENKSVDNYKKLILAKKMNNNQYIELTSTKNNTTNENNIKKFYDRPQSFNPNIKTYKKIEMKKERLLSADNTEKKEKKIKFYKAPMYQSLLCIKYNNRNNKSYNHIYYKKLRKIRIGDRGNISKENGIQKYITYSSDMKKFIFHTNRLLLYRSKLTPKSINVFNKRLNKEIKVFSKEKTPVEKNIKGKIIEKINKLINKMEFEGEKEEKKKSKKTDDKNKTNSD